MLTRKEREELRAKAEWSIGHGTTCEFDEPCLKLLNDIANLDQDILDHMESCPEGSPEIHGANP